MEMPMWLLPQGTLMTTTRPQVTLGVLVQDAGLYGHLLPNVAPEVYPRSKKIQFSYIPKMAFQKPSPSNRISP